MPSLIYLFLLFFTLTSFNSTQPESEFEFILEELTPLEEHSLSGYVPLDLTQAMNNAQIQGLLYIGVQKATQALIQQGSLPAGTYQVAHVQRVEQNHDVPDVQDYRFEVVVLNGQGGENSTIVFNITYDPALGSSEVTSSEVLEQENQLQAEAEQLLLASEEGYSHVAEEEVLLGYAPLDLDQANNNPQIQGLLQIGVRNATGQAIQDGVLASGNYQMVKVTSIEENQDLPNIQSYIFNVEISTGGSKTSNLTFEMTYDTSSETSQVTAYNVQTNRPAPIDKYVPLDLNTISMNPQIQGLVYVGVQNVTQQAIQNNTLPNSTYQVAQINSIGQGSANSNDYQFNVSITNNQGTAADAFFTLLYNNATGGADITSYSIANLAIVTPPLPVSNVTDNSPTIANVTNTTAPVTNTTIIPANTTVPVAPNTTINPQNATIPTATPATGVTSGAPAGWIPVDVYSGQDPMAYQLGEYGYSYVVTAANSAGQIPYSYYTVTSVNGAAKQVQGSLTYYWYDLSVADGLGNSAELVFTMSYAPASGTYNLLNYNVLNVVRAW